MGLNVLETSILGLRWSMIPPEEELAKNPLVFNCTAAVGSIYWQYASLTLTTRRITPESQPQKSEPRAFNNKTTIQRITMYQESQISSAQTITATNLDVAHSLSLPLFLIMWLLLPLFGLWHCLKYEECFITYMRCEETVGVLREGCVECFLPFLWGCLMRSW